MGTPIVCAGIELRREERRDSLPDTSVVTYEGARGGLTIRIEGAGRTDGGVLLCSTWEGYAIVTVRWGAPRHSEAFERRSIAHAAGTSAERCADTLAEMVRSVAVALDGVRT